MVEEAIRNGTWIPPSPGRLGGFGIGRSDRVDLNKKPKLWEAFVEKSDPKGYAEADWDWDSVRPFCATIVTSTGPSVQPPPQPIFPSTASDSGQMPATNFPLNDSANMPSQRLPLHQRIRQFVSPTPPTFITPLPEQTVPTNTNDNSSPNVNEVVLPSGPQKIRVSVLIAMPSRSQSRSSQHNPQPSKFPSAMMLSPSPSPSLNSSTPFIPPSIALTLESSPLGTDQPSHSHHEDGDEELPYMEFGVAEFTMRDESREDADARAHAAGKRPLSMGSSMDAA